MNSFTTFCFIVCVSASFTAGHKYVTKCAVGPGLCDSSPASPFAAYGYGAEGCRGGYGAEGYGGGYDGNCGCGCIDTCSKNILIPKIKNIVTKKKIRVPVIKTIYRKPLCKKLKIPKLGSCPATLQTPQSCGYGAPPTCGLQSPTYGLSVPNYRQQSCYSSPLFGGLLGSYNYRYY